MTLCPGWRSLVGTLAVSVSLSVPADCPANRQRLIQTARIGDVAGAIVEILRGNGPASATHSCWGAVIARRGESLVVLTAAHCFVPPAQQATALAYIKVQNAVVSEPNRVFVHPRFNPIHRSANFDIATFEVPSHAQKVNAMPISLASDPPHVGESVTVLINTSALKSPTWSAVPITEVTDTSLRLAANAPLCLGSSGAPVLRKGTSGYSIVGVTSLGPNDCSRDVMVARLSPALRGFLENTTEGRAPREVSRSCGECIEQAWEGNASCVTSIDACRHDAQCGDAFACMSDFHHRHCSKSRIAPKRSLDLLIRAQRCVCLVECVAECLDFCREL